MTDSLAVAQIEVFTIEDIKPQFKRLGIVPKTHLHFDSHGKVVSVASLTPADYSKLVNDMCIDDSNWVNAGWSNPVGSNLGVPKHKATVNGKEMLCWIDESDFIDDDEAILNSWFVDIFEYLDIGVGATTFKNASAVIKDLAKYNGTSITHFMLRYTKDEKITMSIYEQDIEFLGCQTGRLKSEGGN